MDGYFFDKRKRKRSFIKYLIIFSISFVPAVLFNIYVAKDLSNWAVILLDVVIILAFVLVGNIIASKIFEKKDRKLEAKIKAREEIQKRKKEILEQSYKAKRNKKLKEKEEKEKEVENNGSEGNEQKDK